MSGTQKDESLPWAIAEAVVRQIEVSIPALWHAMPEARAPVAAIIQQVIIGHSSPGKSFESVIAAVHEADDVSMLKKRIADLEEQIARIDAKPVVCAVPHNRNSAQS